MSDIQELDLAALSKQPGNGVYRLRFGSISVPVRYQRGSNDTMIVIFHGAIDRKIRTIPRFQGLVPDSGGCCQLAIADPSLEFGTDISCGWYLGGEKLPLQTDLPKLILALSDLASVKKRIYLGGSAGGFAALFYSWADPGSVCITINPQINLSRYGSNKRFESYLRGAWPGVGSLSKLARNVIIDASQIYTERFDNMVIYLQSVGDIAHYGRQLPEFCNIGLNKSEQFILNISYYGIPGHSNSIPSSFYYPWIRSVIAAPWFNRQAILDTHWALTNKVVAHTSLNKFTTDDKAINESDFRMADILRDYHLRQIKVI